MTKKKVLRECRRIRRVETVIALPGLGWTPSDVTLEFRTPSGARFRLTPIASLQGIRR